jgi:hypothetical protein
MHNTSPSATSEMSTASGSICIDCGRFVAKRLDIFNGSISKSASWLDSSIEDATSGARIVFKTTSTDCSSSVATTAIHSVFSSMAVSMLLAMIRDVFINHLFARSFLDIETAPKEAA